MRDIWLNLEVGYNKHFLVEYCSRDVPDHESNLVILEHFSQFAYFQNGRQTLMNATDIMVITYIFCCNSMKLSS